MRKKIALKALAFLLLFSVLLAGVSKVLVSHGDYREYQWIAGIYEERENSLDAVYIGGSNVYAFWAAPLAWERYGITVHPMACNSMPLAVAKYMIIEARKTQPDALFVVTINGTTEQITGNHIHYLADYMPNSANKFEMIRALCEMGGFSREESWEFYFPLIRYHSRWSELTKEDFHYSVNGLKGASNYSAYLKNVTDVSASFRTTDFRAPLQPYLQSALEDLLDYCDEEQVNVLFVTAPQCRTDEYLLGRYNAVNDLVSSRGYPVLNLLECMGEMGLDLTQDYYNALHTNVHGAIKVTEYLSRYLVENYGFENKKGDTAYQDWDLAYQAYAEEISPYVVESELEVSKHEPALFAPGLNAISVTANRLTVSWEPVPEADGYQIYRKQEETGWALLATVEQDVLSYLDESCRASEKYTYTVMPYQTVGAEMVYGQYNRNGVSATALLDAPTAVERSGAGNESVVTWSRVGGADGYMFYRKEDSGNWTKLADAGAELSYIDARTVDNTAYQYAVRAYQIVNGKIVLGELGVAAP